MYNLCLFFLFISTGAYQSRNTRANSPPAAPSRPFPQHRLWAASSALVLFTSANPNRTSRALLTHSHWTLLKTLKAYSNRCLKGKLPKEGQHVKWSVLCMMRASIARLWWNETHLKRYLYEWRKILLSSGRSNRALWLLDHSTTWKLYGIERLNRTCT